MAADEHRSVTTKQFLQGPKPQTFLRAIYYQRLFSRNWVYYFRCPAPGRWKKGKSNEDA
jgi:hypothetical protein